MPACLSDSGLEIAWLSFHIVLGNMANLQGRPGNAISLCTSNLSQEVEFSPNVDFMTSLMPKTSRLSHFK